MAILGIKVKPGAKSDSFGFDESGRLWVRIAAPAVDGKANEACIRYLAELFKIRRQEIRLKSGAAARFKWFEVEMPETDLQETLELMRNR